MTQVHESPNALEVTGLEVRLSTGETVVEDVDLCLAPGEILGVVGESGSGKTTTALALLGYASQGAAIVGGALRIDGEPVAMDETMRPLRGSKISYVPQNPGRALNAALRVRDAIGDILRAHGREREPGDVESALERVGLEAPIAERFPHQLSGGQLQRVSIAMALCCRPSVVVLDEPTTGLDVVTQSRILEGLRYLRTEERVSMVYVTHDLAVVNEIADRIAVMYAGRVVEEGPTQELVRDPRHPYSRGLLASIPDHVRPRVLDPMPGIAVGVGERPSGCSFAPRCAQRSEQCELAVPSLEAVTARQRVRCIHHQQTPAVKTVSLASIERAARESEDPQPLLVVENLGAEHRSQREVTVAAEQISFSVGRGECVALVGESGSGKTTVARALAGMHPIARGRVLLHGEELRGVAWRRSRDQLRRIQMVYQNPAAALNPRHTVGDEMVRPARVLRGMRGAALQAEADRLLECVRLPARLAGRYPRELSGGELQRVAIARALAADPDVILCDEITSALDVSVQAAVLKLLRDLRDDLGVGLLFITHDLGVVATVADTVLVLDRGSIVDHGPTAQVLRDPTSDYTRRLLEAAPSVSDVAGDGARARGGAPASLELHGNR